MNNSYAMVRRNLRTSSYATNSMAWTTSVAMPTVPRRDAPERPSRRVEIEYQLSAQVLAGAFEADEMRVVATPQERLLDLKEATGLTWDQIARVFGVSKRSVLNWRAGGRMAAGHEEILTDAQTALQRAPADVDLHDWLMTVDPVTGRAPFQELLALRFGDEVSWIDRQPQIRE